VTDRLGWSGSFESHWDTKKFTRYPTVGQVGVGGYPSELILTPALPPPDDFEIPRPRSDSFVTGLHCSLEKVAEVKLALPTEATTEPVRS